MDVLNAIVDMDHEESQRWGCKRASPGGAAGGAKVRFCEGIVRCTQPKDRSLILSPRYQCQAGSIRGLGLTCFQPREIDAGDLGPPPQESGV